MTISCVKIGGRLVGPNEPCYIVAEMSANHGQNFEDAVRIIRAAKEAGADAIKLQTYTPDTITINCDTEPFLIKGTLWEGRKLYELYGEAYTPWEWQPKLKQVANDLGLDCFSTPFDSTAVDFLEKMDVPAHKIASFELVDLPLIRKVARTGKPVIISTGMALLSEIEDAVRAVEEAGGNQLALLKCTSSYPASLEEMNLRTIPHLIGVFNVPVGLSDHTLGTTVPLVAVALGACIVEKHFTLSRSVPGPDSAFSLEPQEFKTMVNGIRMVEKTLGHVHYGVSEHEAKSRIFRRSLFVVKDMAAGEIFSEENVRSIRPGHGLPPKYINEVLGRRSTRDIMRGTPLTADLLSF
jgi:pseudaminic acid synthase